MSIGTDTTPETPVPVDAVEGSFCFTVKANLSDVSTQEMLEAVQAAAFQAGAALVERLPASTSVETEGPTVSIDIASTTLG
jgi:hypothetical protein